MALKRREQPAAPEPQINTAPPQFDSERQSAVDLPDTAEITVDPRKKFTITLTPRHAEWITHRAVAEGRTVENMIDKCVREAWQRDQERVSGASVIAGSAAADAIKSGLAGG